MLWLNFSRGLASEMRFGPRVIDLKGAQNAGSKPVAAAVTAIGGLGEPIVRTLSGTALCLRRLLRG